MKSSRYPGRCTRVTADAVTAARALPAYTNTGVDGYAFRRGDGVGPSSLRLVGASYAGQPFNGPSSIIQDDELPQGHAVRIATGAVLPPGADTVVMQEYCDVEGETVTLRETPDRGANIRHEGADIAKGAVALPAGHRLRPQDIALLGAFGHADVQVLRPLRVAIASTGHELLPQGSLPMHGQIIDTNGLMLAQMLGEQGVAVTMLDPLPDDYDYTAAALQSAAASHDLIITTGGVSVGDRDYVREVLKDTGKIHFWKLAIRPGKP